MATNYSISAKYLIIFILQVIMIIFSTFPTNTEARAVPMQKRKSSGLTLFQELGFKLPVHNGGVIGAREVKRLVPSGSNPETSPESPNRVTLGEVKRLVPSGPNPETSPESPNRVTLGEVKRLVPSGPNPETSPESPNRVTLGKVKRLVPSGPYPETSPESPNNFTSAKA